MQYSTVVFDIDGTLIDTEDAIIHALQWALRKCTGKEYAPSELTFCLGIPGENALRQLGVPDIQTTLAVWDARFKESAGETGLFDGIRPLVETLHSRGIPLGIITSKTREEYQFDFLRRGIGEYFGCSICTEDSETHKPHPGPMLEYLRRTGFPPEKAIYIGDSTYDMQCARSAGVDCALALWGCRRPDGILSDYRLLRPADLLKLVDDTVTVTVDRPLGSRHPERPELLYPVNYGFIEGIIAPDGEEQDAYILGIDCPVEQFTGRKAAVIRRADDIETKWVIVPEDTSFSAEEIERFVRFQEQYHESRVELL